MARSSSRILGETLMRWVACGGVYFGIVFGAGHLFGLIRVSWATSRYGEKTTELLEMPLMLVVIAGAAVGSCSISRFSGRFD